MRHICKTIQFYESVFNAFFKKLDSIFLVHQPWMNQSRYQVRGDMHGINCTIQWGSLDSSLYNLAILSIDLLNANADVMHKLHPIYDSSMINPCVTYKIDKHSDEHLDIRVLIAKSICHDIKLYFPNGWKMNIFEDRQRRYTYIDMGANSYLNTTQSYVNIEDMLMKNDLEIGYES